MKRLAILTSGGDAPGMNAAIRAAVRVASDLGHAMLGIPRGYEGLLNEEFRLLGPRDVGNIIHLGGTMLHTARSRDFHTQAGLARAAERLRAERVDALLAIGGDGTFKGCLDLAEVWGGCVLGIPGTIDNDLWGTDYTIGFDTAVNTALESMDKLRDTAGSMERTFLVEVMGRHAGFIALEAGLTGGAEEILVPEIPVDLDAVCRRLRYNKDHGKRSSMAVVAEGAFPGGAEALGRELAQRTGEQFRICVLGHVQRGGSPTAADRLLATRLGARAVEAALRGETGKMIGEIGGKPAHVLLADAVGKRKPLDPELVALLPRLAL